MFLLFRIQIFATILCVIFGAQLQAQDYSQTVKGQVYDKAVKLPLIGATVVVMNQQNETISGTVTDADGRFRLEKIPVGNQRLKVSFLGYKDRLLPNMQVISGKELDLNIDLEENLIITKEAVITATVDKQKPLNELSAVSTRTFSVEETQKFAMAVNDPARMASAFAGVAVGNDGNNQIYIRGNSSNSMVWRMEGVDIPNPNHFSSVGASGGGVSVLSAQVLSNSDFSTGAFTAEYGNVLSGVFDLRLRKGNADKREYTLTAGVLGFDFSTEGPIALGKRTGSYLVNYRYSTLSVLDLIGVPLGSGVTKYQDLSFNIWLPTERLGSFTIFGLGGLSNQVYHGKADSLAWKEDEFSKYEGTFASNVGVIGLTHQVVRGSKVHIKSVLAYSGTINEDYTNEYQPDYRLRSIIEENHKQTKLTLSSTLSYKLNKQSYFRLGAYGDLLGYGLKQSNWHDDAEALVNEVNSKGNTETAHVFGTWQYRASERLTASIGVHGFGFLLNNKYSFEPRASVKYNLAPKSSISLGYGLHSQMQPLGVYFAKDEQTNHLVNSDLGLTKAHHLVLSYDQMLSSSLRLKAETYYQALSNVPVQRDTATSYSMLNLIQDFPAEALVNDGVGRNYGLELTLEKFLSRGLYFLAASSIYDSEYKGSDGVWHNTQFNLGYVNSLVAGKEWGWNRRNKRRSFGLNIKLTQMGGLRESPLDLEASKLKGESVYDNTQAFGSQLPAYFV